MSEEILINVTPQETRVAVVENGVLQELYIERTMKLGLLCKIFKGRVSRILPGMQAAFIDVGNAFNEWHEENLKKGAGVGLRWYSIAGPISLDVAQALSYDGHPWSINFSIGTPLL